MKFDSPRDARQMGIEMVYQDFALAGNMPIYENIYLGREPGRKFAGLTIIDREKARQMAKDHLDKLKIHVKSIDQTGRGTFRRPAPGGRDCTRDRIRCQGGDHGRADRCARHQGGRQSARP